MVGKGLDGKAAYGIVLQEQNGVLARVPFLLKQLSLKREIPCAELADHNVVIGGAIDFEDGFLVGFFGSADS